MTYDQYQDWRRDVAAMLATMLKADVSRLAAADIASRSILLRPGARAAWKVVDVALGAIAGKVVAVVLDRLGALTFDDLVTIIMRQRKGSQ